MNISGRKAVKSDDRPSFVLTDRLPADTGEKLLGRVVADPRSPVDEYVPRATDTRFAMKGQVYEVADSNFSSLFSVEKNKQAQTKIGQVVGLDLEKLTKDEHSLKTAFVRTRIMEQHKDALKALLGSGMTPEITTLIRDNKGSNAGKGYMVVGYKSCVDAETSKDKQFHQNTNVKIDVPTDTIVTAATHGAISLGEGANIGQTLNKSEDVNASMTSTSVGEQVFAIKYRLLTLRKLNKRDAGQQSVDFGDIVRIKFENGVYGLGVRIISAGPRKFPGWPAD